MRFHLAGLLAMAAFAAGDGASSTAFASTFLAAPTPPARPGSRQECEDFRSRHQDYTRALRIELEACNLAHRNEIPSVWHDSCGPVRANSRPSCVQLAQQWRCALSSGSRMVNVCIASVRGGGEPEPSVASRAVSSLRNPLSAGRTGIREIGRRLAVFRPPSAGMRAYQTFDRWQTRAQHLVRASNPQLSPYDRLRSVAELTAELQRPALSRTLLRRAMLDVIAVQRSATARLVEDIGRLTPSITADQMRRQHAYRAEVARLAAEERERQAALERERAEQIEQERQAEIERQYQEDLAREQQARWEAEQRRLREIQEEEEEAAAAEAVNGFINGFMRGRAPAPSYRPAPAPRPAPIYRAPAPSYSAPYRGHNEIVRGR